MIHHVSSSLDRQRTQLEIQSILSIQCRSSSHNWTCRQITSKACQIVTQSLKASKQTKKPKTLTKMIQENFAEVIKIYLSFAFPSANGMPNKNVQYLLYLPSQREPAKGYILQCLQPQTNRLCFNEEEEVLSIFLNNTHVFWEGGGMASLHRVITVA